MNEVNLIAALLNSRAACMQAVDVGLRPEEFSDAGKALVGAAIEQYKRDADLQRADAEIIEGQVRRKHGDDEFSQSVLDLLGSLPQDTSAVNVLEEYRLLRLHGTATEAATMLVRGMHGEKLDAVLSQYQKLRSGEAEGERKYRLDADDYRDEGARLPLSPQILSAYVGGVRLGHHILVFGRPDSGKSLFTLNSAAFFCLKGRRVLYCANEEPERDITQRLLARLAGTTVKALEDPDAIHAAILKAGDAYSKNWHLFHETSMSLRQIAGAIQRVKPTLVVVDQLKNLVADDSDNRALQLDKLARGVRALGVKYHAVTMSVAQAGDSAHQKMVLQQNDVEWSNTGIPGATDLMLGIGVTDTLYAENKRIISICKSKTGCRHGAVPVYIDPERTAFLSQPPRRN